MHLLLPLCGWIVLASPQPPMFCDFNVTARALKALNPELDDDTALSAAIAVGDPLERAADGRIVAHLKDGRHLHLHWPQTQRGPAVVVPPVGKS